MNEHLHLLIVDDEPGMLAGAVRALKDYRVQTLDESEEVRFEIATAENGEVALRKIAGECPDIILLDYKLPGVNGLEVLQKVTEQYPDVLTIMITAYATLETAVLATKQGAYDFVAKPFTPAELKNVVQKAARHILLARRARQLAEERRRIRFEFISILAHELKSPLNAVEGYLRGMRDHVAGEELAAYDKSIARSLLRVNGMRKLIYDLLDLTRIESGEKKRNLTRVSVTDIAKEALANLSEDALGRDIEMELESTANVEMQADRGELEIIMNNLVSNAVKYNTDGGRVGVRVLAGEETVIIEVDDTGIGLTEEEAARLFNDFVRIKNEKTRGILGSGLGLAIVRKLASLYGGEVSVESTPDEGSKFTVVLTRYPRSEAASMGS